MAGKGYRPALFELVRKGPLKPNQKGTLTTPKWFYNRKSEGTVEPLRSDAVQKSSQQQDFSADYEDDVALKQASEPPDRPESLMGLQLADKKLAFWAPYWAIVLAFMGLFLCFSVAFWLGQVSVRGIEETTEKQTMTEAGLGQVPQGSIRPEVLDLSANLVDNVGASPTERQAPGTATVPDTNITAQNNDVVKGRNCLVMCSDSSQQKLRSVQEFFSRKGVRTKIGRFKGSYIVYCDIGVDHTSSSEAVTLRNRMIEIGRRYNIEKPSGAASFLASTFESAYWAARDNITKIEQ